MSKPVLVEKKASVALVTLNRPDVLNALDSKLLEALFEALQEVAADRSLRALVLNGAGRHFAAGADIAAMSKMSAHEGLEFSRLGHKAFDALEALAIPSIAAVGGYALGGGCELALACDWIHASTKARFGQPEVKLGLIPGFGGTSRLARRVGRAWAKELVLLGEPIDAQTAERIGLVNHVYEAEVLLEETLKMAEAIAKRGPLAVAGAKQLLVEGADADQRVANLLEQNAFGSVFATQDREEGLAAFLEKREAKFSGS